MTTPLWFDIIFAIFAGSATLVIIVILAQYSIYKALEYKYFKKHLERIEQIHKEKNNGSDD